MDHWETLVALELKQDVERKNPYQTTTTRLNIQHLEVQKQEASQETQYALQLYTYSLLEKTWKVADGITAETVANATKTFQDDRVAQSGNTKSLGNLLKQKSKVHAKEK